MRVFTLVHWMPLSVDAMCKKILSLTAKNSQFFGLTSSCHLHLVAKFGREIETVFYRLR